jgi:hypothetical protein
LPPASTVFTVNRGGVTRPDAISSITITEYNIATNAGFDGSVGTQQGAFPLLTTVDRRGPLANVRKNLKTYTATSGGPRLAVVASPRVVSNATKRTIQHVASVDFGVQIVNIHDQADFANRLYRDHRWRLELLGICGVQYRADVRSEDPYHGCEVRLCRLY